MKKIIGLLGISLGILVGCTPSAVEDSLSFFRQTTAEGQETTEAVIETTAETEWPEKATIFVHVCGAVVNPGVYELPVGSRAYEALAMAGGATDTAAVYTVNLAEELTDEQQLYIPEEGETMVSASVGVEGVSRINLNTATKEQLMSLHGIGDAKAEAIVKYRKKIGGFTSVEQIMEVEGIKEAGYEKIKDDITI